MVFAFFLAACAGKGRLPETSRPPTALDRSSEEIHRTDELQKKHGVWLSPRLKTYLEEIASKLRGSPVSVVLLDSAAPVLECGPVNTLYLSRGALEPVRFENELAFLLGRAVAAFSPEPSPSALDKAAVRLAYGAAYDPRGAVSLMERWSEAEGASSYADRLKAVRSEIAKLSPLRDPIVSTQRFEEARSLMSSRKKGGHNAPRSALN